MLFSCVSVRIWLPFAGAILGLAAAAGAAPVISEIMFHPPGVPEPVAKEWLEISNAADVGGWKFTKGITYTIPAGTVAAPGGILVIAADRTAFLAEHPNFSGTVVGGWSGVLSNSGETLRLENAAGELLDEVKYADEGDWAVRARPAVDAYGFQGWVWDSPADGGGRSLERKSARGPGKVGQNWTSSSAAGGTPGTGLPHYNSPQVLLDEVRHQPVVPRSTQPITVYARVLDQIDGTVPPTQTLYWRRDGQTGFTAAPMTRVYSQTVVVPASFPLIDETYEAVIPPQLNNTIIEYYVSVTGDLGEAATWPAPARTSAPGVVPEVYAQAANALLQVDNTFNAGTPWVGGDRPVYRVIMTAVEREQLRTIQTTSGRQESDAAMNATFISQDGSGLEVKYLTSVRNRGFGSRLGPPNNFHVSMRADDLWKDRPALQLNCRYPHSQVLASNVFALGGIAEQQARPVRLIMNGVSLAETGVPMYGSYARIETLNGEWVNRHFPGDKAGNMYRVDDHAPNSVGVIPGDLGSGEFRFEGTNPLAYADTYQKRTNEDLDDWSDLIELCEVISAPATGGTAAQPAISDAQYPARVRELIDVDQWFSYLALDALVGNQEGGLPTGRADDFAMYRGVVDSRFTLIPHDFDTCFDFNTRDGTANGNPSDRSIWSFDEGTASLLGLQRLFRHPDLVPIYYQKMLYMVNNVFTRERLDPLIDELIGSWAAPAAASVKVYINDRRASVLSQIQQNYSLTTNLTPGSTGYLESAAGAVTLSGTFNVAQTRSLRLNGQAAVLNYRTLGTAVAGTWSYTAAVGSGFLAKGINRVTAEFWDGPGGTGNVLQRFLTDIYVPENGSFTSVQGILSPVTVPDLLTVQAAPGYVPGVPVLVRVDARLADGSLERGVWNRTATLTAPNGLTLSPNTVTLYNGTGSALVRIGSTVGGAITSLVPSGGTLAAPVTGAPLWRYLDSGGEPPADWRSSLTYDDSAWKSGTLQAGAGDGDERSLVANVPSNTNTRRAFFFRLPFNVADPLSISTLRLKAVVDDGAIFYINGTEVYRDNMPPGIPSLTTIANTNRAGTEESVVRTFDISAFAGLLLPGQNLLAVRGHNYGIPGGASNDFSLDCGLEAVSPISDPGNFTLTATADGRTTTHSLTSLGTSTPPGLSGTLPSGETVWSGKIRISGDVIVPADGTLRISAGTVVLLDGNATPGSAAGADLIINGSLLCGGTASAPVTLTCSDPANRWGELFFNNTTAPCLLQFTHITQGGRSPGRGHTGKGPLIRLASSALTFENCVLGDSPAKAIYTSGTGRLTIRRSLITRTITGPELEDGCSLLLEDSNIQEILPNARESDSPAPDDEDCLYVHNTTGVPIIVRRSVLARCGDDVFDGLGGPLIVEDSILREGWDKGMSLLNNDLTISRTLIVDCDKAIVPKSSTVATRTVNADHVTIISEDHDTTQAPWGYAVAPSNPDPDTASTGFYTQNKTGQSAAGAILAINARNCIVFAKEPVKVDPLYPAANTVIAYSNLVDADDSAAAAWPGTGNIALPLQLENQAARRLAALYASPCRDSGDPASPNDPDGSRTDMGALVALPGNLSSGEVRWTRSGSPYRILDNLTVPAGLTLRIDPGVQVQVAANRRLTVLGRLLAQGSAAQHILFSGIPGTVATGDADPVKNGVQTGAPKWGGLRISDSMAQENIVSWVDFIDAQGTTPFGEENYGSVGLIRSWGLVEYCTFAGTHLRMCYGRNSKMLVRRNTFPDMFIFDPVLGRIENTTDFVAAADNSQEPLKVEYPVTDAQVLNTPAFTNGQPAGGFFRVYYNEFNGNRGHNDVFDADSGRWNVPGQFVLDCRYNRFLGLTGDEHIDLGGDAYIASNLFQRGAKDQWTSDTGYSNAISSGDRGTGTTIMVARNLFYDVDHAINLKANTGTIFEHNTVADLHPDFNYSGTSFGTPFTQAVKCAPINVFIPEDGANPTRGDGGYLGFNIFSNVPRLISGADSRLNGGVLVNDVTTKIEFGGNLVYSLGTTDLGVNHPGGAFNSSYGRNTAGNPRLTAAYQPDFGSEALGTAPFGLNYGAAVAEWAYIANVPDTISVDRNPTFFVGGPGIVAFKWRLNGGPWSARQVIGSGGVFPRASATVRQAAVSLTNLSSGPQIFEVLGEDMAGNWQDSDPAVESGPQAAPTFYAWTVAAQPEVRLNEVLAAGANGAPDFIELANFGGSTTLTGWRLTDSPDKSGYVFPAGTTIANETVLLLPASVTNIGLDADGDEVLLYNDAGILVDRLTFGPQAIGYSLGRNGTGATWLLSNPTPGAGNPSAGIVPLGNPAVIRISEWFADSQILFPEDWIELVNPSNLPVALSGLFLSDDAATGSGRRALPPNSYIAPAGYALFIADGGNGGNHLPFLLDAEQEAVALDFGNVRIDTALFGPGLIDQSQSRTVNGLPAWSQLPTRGFATEPGDAAYQNALNILRNLRITEIMYNPAGGNDYEYVEVTNTGNVALNLEGVAFVEGITFAFTTTTLAPGGQTVLVSKEGTFRARYGSQVPVAGTYGGRLDNSGETLALALPAPFNGNVLRFRYESFWQAPAEGLGRSLQIASPTTVPSGYGDHLAWQASRVNYGTPGGFNAPPPLDYPSWAAFYAVPGGVGSDDDGDGLISLMEFALRSDPLKSQLGDGADRSLVLTLGGGSQTLTVNLPVSSLAGGYGSQGISYILQDSDDLTTWRDLAVKTPAAASWATLTTPAAAVQTGAAANGLVPVSLTAPSAADGAVAKYIRLKTTLVD